MTMQYSTQDRNNKLDALVYGAATAGGSTIAPWVATTAYTARSSWVINSGNLYLCTTSGTSAGSGGPTTTANDITDGTAHWTFIGKAGVGSAPTLNLYNGTPPANPAAALSGNTLLATGVLPAAWLNAAATGSLTKAAGAWTVTGQAGAGAGTAATFFRILDIAGVVRFQGTVTAAGGGGDMTLDNNSLANGQSETTNTFTINGGNA